LSHTDRLILPDDLAPTAPPQGQSAASAELFAEAEAHPPLPRFVLSVGVTGHRADRLTRALQASARSRAEDALDMIAALAAETRIAGNRWYSPEPNELRLISALAEGADTICAEVALARNYLLDAPLPFTAEEYARDFTADEAAATYRGLLARASRVLELPGDRQSEEAAYSLAGGAILASADILLAIWNGQGSGGRGGTGVVVASALAMGKPVIHIPLDANQPVRLLWHGEGPAGGSWHSALEPPAEDFNRETLGEAIRSQMLPPDEPMEIQSLEAFLGETEQLRMRRIEYPLLLAATGAQPLRSSAWRKDPYLATTRADWSRFDAHWTARMAHASFGLLEEGYAWADHLANRFAQSFRSGHVVNFVFSATAVALALLGYLIGGNVKVLFVIFELLLIAAIVANTRVGHAEAWQQRWLDYRQLAERLRPMRSLKLLAVARPPVVSASSRTGTRRWIDWYAGAIWRQLGQPAGLIDSARTAELAKLVEREEVGPEVAYHHRNAHRMAHVNHRLHQFGSVCFISTVLLCIGFLLTNAFFDEHLAKETAILFTVATATLPAFGTAAYGLRVQGDFAGSSARSGATAEALSHLALELEGQPTLARTAAIANAAAAVMLVDIAEWRLTYEQRALEIPG
jgi:hypothetical protein